MSNPYQSPRTETAHSLQGKREPGGRGGIYLYSLFVVHIAAVYIFSSYVHRSVLMGDLITINVPMHLLTVPTPVYLLCISLATKTRCIGLILVDTVLSAIQVWLFLVHFSG